MCSSSGDREKAREFLLLLEHMTLVRAEGPIAMAMTGIVVEEL